MRKRSNSLSDPSVSSSSSSSSREQRRLVFGDDDRINIQNNDFKIVGSNKTNLSEQELQQLKHVQSFKSNEIEIVSKIATGGFAEVYQVKIVNSSKIYAGKKMLANRAQLERNILKFKDELLIMNRLGQCGCKKITQLVGYCFENPVFWIVMEFMDLGDLHSIIHFTTNTAKQHANKNDSASVNERIRSNQEIELIKSIQTDFKTK
ncbi:hypothetical protein C9374_013002 [Naegleria lovaniensis]|uniref:mitogen-activated protein kinase kinase n=1 Tax=Naegleria lovaniensis TaxID=51637 RepID=A0AA88GC80_NAELO|nr:uncharacterized protein C9374_013002 [Naegleria lovaniensis]KAG2372972.1 hypothetical protein C9374_013002 [Naegleria lovaniensis]